MHCKVWVQFLSNEDDRTTLCRPFLYLNRFETSKTLNFYSDASGKIGFGAVFEKHWIHKIWLKEFLTQEPSIEFQELLALCAAIFTWEHLLFNTRIAIFCDNQAVVNMVNNTTSSCPNCMILIRLLVLNNLQFNRRVFVKFVSTKQNFLADASSRNQIDQFRKLAPERIDYIPWPTSPKVWPVEKV